MSSGDLYLSGRILDKDECEAILKERGEGLRNLVPGKVAVEFYTFSRAGCEICYVGDEPSQVAFALGGASNEAIHNGYPSFIRWFKPDEWQSIKI